MTSGPQALTHGVLTQALVVPPVELVTIEVDHTTGETLTYEQYYVTDDDQVPHVEQYLAQLPAFGLDTETGGLDHRTKELATIQVGNPLVALDGALGCYARAYVIDVRGLSPDVLLRLVHVIADPARMKLGQNIKFELKWIGELTGVMIENVADTQITEHIIRAGLLNSDREQDDEDGDEKIDRAVLKHSSMKHLCRLYLGLEIDKGEDVRLTFYATPQGQHTLRHRTYAAGDVIYPFYIWRYQKQEMEDRALSNIVRLEWELIPCLAESELKGIAIDAPAWRALWQESVAKEQEALKKLDRLLLNVQGDLFDGSDANVRPLYMRTPKTKPVPLNWDSPIQARWAIAQYCRATGWGHEVVFAEKRLLELRAEHGKDWWDARVRQGRKKGELDPEQIPDYVIPEDQYCLLMKKDKPTLLARKIRRQLPAEIVDGLVEFSKYHKRVTSFGKEWLNKNVTNGILYVEFHQALTATGRMSSQPNSQQIPNDPRYRACFKPRPGYVFVTLDYSQIEPRLSAEQSGDETYRATFLDADDIYCRVAETMTGSYPDKHGTDDDKKTRKAFKIVVLSMAYRMGAGKLRDRLTLELKEDVPMQYAWDLWGGFLTKHEKIKEFQNRCFHEATHWHTTDHGERVPNPRRVWDRFLQAPVTWVEGVCGRKRMFGPEAKNIYTEAPNAPIQGSSASITKAAAVMVRRHAKAQGIDAWVVNYVHDELVWEVRRDQAAAFALEAKRILEEAGRFWIKSVPVLAEFPEGSTDGITMWWTKEVDDAAAHAA